MLIVHCNPQMNSTAHHSVQHTLRHEAQVLAREWASPFYEALQEPLLGPIFTDWAARLVLAELRPIAILFAVPAFWALCASKEVRQVGLILYLLKARPAGLTI